MDERVIPRFSAWGRLLGAALACAATGAVADTLPDPTQPPPEVAGGAPSAGPVLQSVRIGAGGRFAVIDGQLLKEGESYRDAKLVRISAGEVVLSGPSGEQVLLLFPDMEKTVRTQRVPRTGPATPNINRTAPSAVRTQP